MVAPLVGAWIEIMQCIKALSSRYVAPLVGAWIEIYHDRTVFLYEPSRSPRGSVD